MTKALRRVVVLASAIALIAAGPAPAGVYKVRACDAADGSNASWRLFSSRPTVTASVACPSNGDQPRGSSAHNVVARGNAQKSVKRGPTAALVCTGPPGTSIVGVRAGCYFYRA